MLTQQTIQKCESLLSSVKKPAPEQSSDNVHYSWSNNAEYCLKKVGWHIRMKKQTVLQEKDKLTFEIVLGDLWQAKDLGLKRLAEKREPLKIHWLKIWKMSPYNSICIPQYIVFSRREQINSLQQLSSKENSIKLIEDVWKTASPISDSEFAGNPIFVGKQVQKRF